MGSQKSREQRRVVKVRATMRISADWVGVTICNVSSRGLMAKCADPPPRGAYVEIRQRGYCIVGRVAWSQGLRFGIRTQDPIDVAALLAQPTIKGRRAQQERRVEVRKAARTRVVPRPDLQYERSRRLSRAFEWAAVVGVAAFAVSQLAALAGHVLSNPLASAGLALTGR